MCSASLVRVKNFSTFRFFEGVVDVDDFLFFFVDLGFFKVLVSSISKSLPNEEECRREEVGESGGAGVFGFFGPC